MKAGKLRYYSPKISTLISRVDGIRLVLRVRNISLSVSSCRSFSFLSGVREIMQIRNTRNASDVLIFALFIFIGF